MTSDGRENNSEEPKVIINDRRVRYDVDEQAGTPGDNTSAPSSAPPSPPEGLFSPTGEKSLREVAEAAREGRLLALLSGMVATHLYVDPATGLPDDRFSPREARFYLDLIDLYAVARGESTLLPSPAGPESPVEREEPRLGHIPAILGAMAVHALGIDPQTGRPGGEGNLEAAKLYIDLIDFVSGAVGSAMSEDDRSYMKDILYQTKMFFVRQKDRGGAGGGPGA